MEPQRIFTRAQLEEAIQEGKQLVGADLYKAQLEGASLSGARLKGACQLK